MCNKSVSIKSVLFSLFVFAFSLTHLAIVQNNWDELYTRYARGLLFSCLIKVTLTL